VNSTQKTIVEKQNLKSNTTSAQNIESTGKVRKLILNLLKMAVEL